ncbi:14505_t:CDS:2, partial [Acaulospora morrowiae]
MSTTIQNIDQVSTEVKSSKPTWQDIEKAIVIITQAAEDLDIYILDNAKKIFPNEEKYIESKKQYQECNDPSSLQNFQNPSQPVLLPSRPL